MIESTKASRNNPGEPRIPRKSGRRVVAASVSPTTPDRTAETLPSDTLCNGVEGAFKGVASYDFAIDSVIDAPSVPVSSFDFARPDFAGACADRDFGAIRVGFFDAGGVCGRAEAGVDRLVNHNISSSESSSPARREAFAGGGAAACALSSAQARAVGCGRAPGCAICGVEAANGARVPPALAPGCGGGGGNGGRTVRGGNGCASRLNNDVNAQIARNASGTKN